MLAFVIPGHMSPVYFPHKSSLTFGCDKLIYDNYCDVHCVIPSFDELYYVLDLMWLTSCSFLLMMLYLVGCINVTARDWFA